MKNGFLPLLKNTANGNGADMNEAITRMLDRYECRSVGDQVRALREIMQEIALLGLWRSRFFEKAAFYGGTALRILYGLDRFSEDLDFSLLHPETDFTLSRYGAAIERELRSFGFDAEFTVREKSGTNPIKSAFLKANTLETLLTIRDGSGSWPIPRDQALKIKIEVDTDPPPGFSTENKFVLQPIPFSVRTFSPSDMFAGKMHAVLLRRWKGRVKGRDWYDLVWYAANHPRLHLEHLAERMRQSRDLEHDETLTPEKFIALARKAVDLLDVNQARREVEPFVKTPESVAVWSKEFFHDIIGRIVIENQ
jgi:predicted nucleotidyltransferase component of viral defense system